MFPTGVRSGKDGSLSLNLQNRHRELVTEKGVFLLVTTLRRENQAILIEYKVY